MTSMDPGRAALAVATALILLAAGVTAFPPAASGAEADTDTTRLPAIALEARPWLHDVDLSDAFVLPSVAWDPTAIPGLDEGVGALPANGVFGNAAGCVNEANVLSWAVAGGGQGPCDWEEHDWGFQWTYIRCDHYCYTDISGTTEPDWGGFFGFIWILCTGGSQVLISWDPGMVHHLSGFCIVKNAFGPNPSSFQTWDSACGLGLWWNVPGENECLHTDNLADLAAHLLV